MSPPAPVSLSEEFHWKVQPEAAAFVGSRLQSYLARCSTARMLGDRLRDETGTRLIDWIDYFALAGSGPIERQLADSGFRPEPAGTRLAWHHPDGIFPKIYLDDDPSERAAIRVDSVADFLTANQLDSHTHLEGEAGAPLRKAKVFFNGGAEMWVIERHGCPQFDCPEVTGAQIHAAAAHRAHFAHRRRKFADPADGFEHVRHLFDAAARDLGNDWACELFFEAEREYWQGRNRAAQAQKRRQDALGMGWANHDHHTYRSSREYFVDLICMLEHLGFECRERFYAGREAGWGAQVLEHSACGLVIFADVDLTPEDLVSDFAHEPLPGSERLGTVGLWCGLHGEAFLEAGMHHLECQFDFDAARGQLAAVGVATMKPFTEFPHLKQAFTAGEMWPVAAERAQRLLADGLITGDQAREFVERGAIGSHLEILERNDGYKGFNQTGISEIITQTDPRRAAAT